jgi:hypothetical protein
MRALVNENRPGSAAILSQPQAAMVSVRAVPPFGAELAAEQQSSKSRTSEAVDSKRVCTADQSKDAYCLLFVLFFWTHYLALGKTTTNRIEKMTNSPTPC